MSEEHSPSPADKTPPKKRSGQSVVHYIAILFAAAFFLLALTYFMERRQNEEALSDLSQSLSGLQASVSAMESVDALREENAALQIQVDELTEELANVRAAVAEEYEGYLDEGQRATCAMDWLREIQGLYQAKSYRAARAMLTAFEETGLSQSLPVEPLHSYDGDDAPAPAETYEVIKDALF